MAAEHRYGTRDAQGRRFFAGRRPEGHWHVKQHNDASNRT